VEIRDTRYAKTPDGVYIAYQVTGEGPVDFVWQFDHTGDVDLFWERPAGGAFMRAMSGICRVILHDRRGTGLSSRNVPLPNLETRSSDLMLVLDTVGSDRPVLGGFGEGGAANVVFAATYPERVRSTVWFEPLPRVLWTPEFPWGAKPEYVEADQRALDLWGTNAYGEAWVDTEQIAGGGGPDEDQLMMGMMSRHTATPDVARELARIWYETDVMGVLPSVRAPTLLITLEESVDGPGAAQHVASLMPDATVALLPGEYGVDEVGPVLDVLRPFLGVEPPVPELDTVLATVLFTDIVDSTRVQAQLGDHGWKELVLRHHEVVREALRRFKGTENDTAGDGFFATFDGPARAVRCAQEVVTRVRELGVEVRAGVHTGECEIVDGKHAGIAVSIGARVMACAGPSEVLASQTVKDLVAGSGLVFEEAGQHELKGVPDRWRLYRVVS
jgi:pimeloyl-ACP methyl ester carboxylesterase